MRRLLLLVGVVGGSLVNSQLVEGAPPAGHPTVSTIHPYVRYPRASSRTTYTEWSVPALCKAYSFPTGLAGNGVIGILEFGGGWNQADLNAFSNQYLGGNTISVTNVSIDGTQNNPNQNVDDDVEVELDIQCSVAAYYYATGKIPKVYVFFSNGDYVNTINAAASSTYGCDVLSISWGAPEADWQSEAPGYAAQVEAAAAAAAAKGLVIFAAAGDYSSSDGDGSSPHVDMPASCPHIIAGGGTTKTTSSEVVWGDGRSTDLGTGGGYSTIFSMPSWQTNFIGTASFKKGGGRMVPDVAADANPNTGLIIATDGDWYLVGGTSAVAPLYAGLFAAFGSQSTFVTPMLWNNPQAFKDITSGSNGAYSAGTGPDPCTGLGVPIGTSIAAVIGVDVPTPTTNVVAINYNTSTKTLTLAGDTNNNSLSVTLSGKTLQLSTTGGTKLTLSTNSGSAGSQTTSASITGFSGTLIVDGNLSDGNDSVSFSGLSISTVDLELGAGNDAASLTLCTVTTCAIDGGTGTDVFTSTSTKITTNENTNFP